ncbi:hypothetical protein [Arsenicibacter rosenii]|uniref:Uncharacterized protein n=1 Tax=Arsenicibacter rosenii TaxID=1750698 RepID=A0A1S2VCM2_9BACT|nr:hypothetical protein [Arsenicibacter rosenii]OIN56170.1 hypothetical protein BLX24_26200 [Arsenicibacter rosenii]
MNNFLYLLLMIGSGITGSILGFLAATALLIAVIILIIPYMAISLLAKYTPFGDIQVKLSPTWDH